jgi:hypothetical protein
MMWGAAYMVRRLSAVQWEMKYDAEYCRKRIAELTVLLARPAVAGPSYEPCQHADLCVPERSLRAIGRA